MTPKVMSAKRARGNTEDDTEEMGFSFSVCGVSIMLTENQLMRLPWLFNMFRKDMTLTQFDKDNLKDTLDTDLIEFLKNDESIPCAVIGAIHSILEWTTNMSVLSPVQEAALEFLRKGPGTTTWPTPGAVSWSCAFCGLNVKSLGDLVLPKSSSRHHKWLDGSGFCENCSITADREDPTDCVDCVHIWQRT